MARRPRTHEVWMRPKEHGAALKRKRLRAGYTQRELGLLVKCSHAMIGLLERDETTVGDALAARIAKRLDVDVEDLFEDRPVVSSRRVVGSGQVPTAARNTSRRRTAA